MNIASRPFPAWARIHLKIEAVSALALGLAFIFLPPDFPLYDPLTPFISHNIFRCPLPPLSLQSTHPLLDQSLALSGMFSVAIGVASSLAIFHGYEEWLYLSIPARLAVSAMVHLVFMLALEKASPLMFEICIWDGVWAGGPALAVGSVSGKVPEAYERGKKKL